jgi:hypothetical protein
VAVRPGVDGGWGEEWDRAAARVAGVDLRRAREATACAPSVGRRCHTRVGSRASR